ncbi:ABC transporter related [Alkaliphilus metalliredigens QYMF]|uniref:ABC transporter related n=1 Tax=Alkaliphilus metalliredigens (strain QYMF) TaxID=293826 RepID=A6TPQ3_ALKMQ|nr:ABC transporter ATP-binding protein [Alkaliphilus metalliredigens]ABR48171.1 ABC transporter related [Alkaliphilus metalliredigens QYMF]
MTLMEIKNLSIQYNQQLALHNFNLTIQKNKIIAVVGESGSGKSTLIHGIMGLLPNNGEVIQGEILYDGKNLLKNNYFQWRKTRGNKIALVFQDASTYFNPKRKIGKQFIESILSHRNVSREEAYTMACQALEDMYLPSAERVMDSYAFQLSGGMKQRTAMAMAMVMKPDILLADEPTSALDVTIQAQVVKLMMKQREETAAAIVIVTHNMGVASYMADEIVVMKNGVIVEHGSKDQIIYNPKHPYTQKLLLAVPELEDDSIV